MQAGVVIVDRESDVYRLRHALLREAVYGDLLPGERVRLHAAYARLLADDSTGAAAELAYHCLATHDLTGAMTASLRAADEASAISAPVEALRHLKQAIACGARSPIRASCVAVTGSASCSAPPRPPTWPVIVPRPWPWPGMRWQPWMWSPLRSGLRSMENLAGTCTSSAGSRRRWVRMQAVALVPAQPPTRLRAQASAAAAQALAVAGRQDEARRWSNEALSIAQALSDAEVATDALTTLGMIESTGDPAKAHALFAAADSDHRACRQPR